MCRSSAGRLATVQTRSRPPGGSAVAGWTTRVDLLPNLGQVRRTARVQLARRSGAWPRPGHRGTPWPAVRIRSTHRDQTCAQRDPDDSPSDSPHTCPCRHGGGRSKSRRSPTSTASRPGVAGCGPSGTSSSLPGRIRPRPPTAENLRLLANEFECQAGNDEGREKDRQDPLSGASEGDDFALGGVEGLGSAGVSAVADLQGVTSGFDRYLDRVVQFHATRHARRRPRRRTCRGGPPLRLPCASASALRTLLVSSCL